LVHFSLKICNLVATILVIFHWGNFSKVVCFSHMQNFSQFKGGAWPKWPNGKYAYDTGHLQTAEKGKYHINVVVNTKILSISTANVSHE